MTTQSRPAPANVAILGCGRSGTSIFGELFEAIPGYTYYSEPFLADVPFPASGPIAVKVPRTAAGSSPPTGASVSLDDLRSVLPDPMIFWQVRHPLDAICSLRVGIAQDWAHHPRPPDWQDWIERPLVERCAHHWATINGAGYALVRGEAVVNRFEDMIRDPVACAVTTCRLVGGDTTAPELVAWADRVQDTNNERFVEAVTSRGHSRPDHDRRVDRWRDNLSPAHVDAVRPIVAAAAATFGYELP